MAAKKSDPGQYTRPDLRDEIKAEVTAGDKGGSPGQWSARKAQLVTHEYEKQGGGYKQRRTEEQESLKQWSEEQWTTSDGKPAERAGGTTRYLPAKAWDKLSGEEKGATNRKKQQGSKQGQQFVPNTPAAAEARAEVGKKRQGTKAVARKKPATKSAARAAAKKEVKLSSAAAKKQAAAKIARSKPAVKSTAEADRKAAQKKKVMAASRKAAAQTRKRQAERSSRRP